jgi:uncharacterized protein (DUF1015 family)
MARIRPFRAFRYSPAAGPVENLVTQPYDKISPEMQARYLSLSPYNLVRIILGPKSEADSETDNVYTRAAAYFRRWAEEGILVQDPEPALFAYFQEFAVPDSGITAVRKGFIGLGAVEDYSAGVVHRHEQTLSGPKKDRLQLLEHTRAHFGQIFMLYPDAENAVDRLLDECASGSPVTEVTDEYGTIHRLWRMAEPGRIRLIQDLMADKKLIIADGHHRYETALAFHRAHPELEGAAWVMMTFVNMYSPGLKILATHRVLSGLKDFSADALVKASAPDFRTSEMESLEGLRRAWSEPHGGKIRIGAATERGARILLFERDRRPGDLDVAVLHSMLIQKALGIDEEAVREEKHIRYIRGVEAALREVQTGAADLAFLLEPTSIQDVADTSFAGRVMPQKSTDFYPKLLSGMTIYRLE